MYLSVMYVRTYIQTNKKTYVDTYRQIHMLRIVEKNEEATFAIWRHVWDNSSSIIISCLVLFLLDFWYNPLAALLRGNARAWTRGEGGGIIGRSTIGRLYCRRKFLFCLFWVLRHGKYGHLSKGDIFIF